MWTYSSTGLFLHILSRLVGSGIVSLDHTSFKTFIKSKSYVQAGQTQTLFILLKGFVEIVCQDVYVKLL